jgi:hypothetical protein
VRKGYELLIGTTRVSGGDEELESEVDPVGGTTGVASEEMVEFSASGAPERPATSLAQARRGDEVAIGTVG